MPPASTDHDQPPPDPSWRDRARPVVSGVAGTIGVVALLVAAVGWWSVRTLTDSSWVGPRVESLLADPIVSDAIAGRVVDAVVETVDVRSAVVDLAPSQLEPVADLLLTGLRPQVEDVVSSFVRRDEVRRTVAAAAERAYGVAVDLVEGRSVVDGVVIVGDEVRVVVLPVVGRALEALQELGLLADVDLPELEPGGDPAAQRAELSQALDRQLPDDFGEIVVYRNDTVERAGDGLAVARDLFVTLGRTVWVAFTGGIVLVALSIRTARRRFRAAGIVAAALATGVVLLRVVSGRLVDTAVDLSAEPAGRLVIGDLLGELQQRLVRTSVTVAVLTVTVTLLAVAIGRPAEPESEMPAGTSGRAVRRVS